MKNNNNQLSDDTDPYRPDDTSEDITARFNQETVYEEPEEPWEMTLNHERTFDSLANFSAASVRTCKTFQEISMTKIEKHNGSL